MLHRGWISDSFGNWEKRDGRDLMKKSCKGAEMYSVMRWRDEGLDSSEYRLTIETISDLCTFCRDFNRCRGKIFRRFSMNFWMFTRGFSRKVSRAAVLEILSRRNSVGSCL